MQMKQIQYNRAAASAIFLATCRIAVGLVLVYSSLPKILHPYAFLDGIYKYEILGRSMGLAAAIIIPWLELLLALCLLAGVCLLGAMLATCILMVGYTFASISVIWRGLPVGCACFGNGGDFASRVNYLTVGRSTLICVMTMLGWAILVGIIKRDSSGIVARPERSP